MPVPQPMLATDGALHNLPDLQPTRDVTADVQHNGDTASQSTSPRPDEAAYALDDSDPGDTLGADELGAEDSEAATDPLAQPYDLDAHNKRRARAKLSEVSRRRSAVRDGDFVESDLCGRGDPRVFDALARSQPAPDAPRLDGAALCAIADIQCADGVRYTSSSRHMAFHKRAPGAADADARRSAASASAAATATAACGAGDDGAGVGDDAAPGCVTAPGGARKRGMRSVRDADTAAARDASPHAPPLQKGGSGSPDGGARHPVTRTLSFPFRRSRSLYDGVCRMLRKRRAGGDR